MATGPPDSDRTRAATMTSERPRTTFLPVTVQATDSIDHDLDPPDEHSAIDAESELVGWEAWLYDFHQEVRVEDFTSPVIAQYISERPFRRDLGMYQATRHDLEMREDSPESSGPESFAEVSAEQAQVNGSVSDTRLTSISEPRPAWRGPAFRLRTLIQAKMKWLDYWIPRETSDSMTSSKPVIRNPEDLPATISGHEIVYCSSPNLAILSPHLDMELSHIITHYPPFLDAEEVELQQQKFEHFLPYPYPELMFFFKEITEAVEAGPRHDTVETTETAPVRASQDPLSNAKKFRRDPQLAHEHLKALQHYLKPSYDHLVADYEAGIANMEISFESLWYLFKPGTFVYVNSFWTPWVAAVVQQVEMKPKRYIADATLQVYWWALTSDGGMIARSEFYETINRFEGRVPVTSLQICPVDLWDRVHGDSRRLQAIKRGAIMEKALRKGHLLASYKDAGTAHDLGQGGRVVVDHRLGQEMSNLGIKPPNIEPNKKHDKWTNCDKIYINDPWRPKGHYAALSDDFGVGVKKLWVPTDTTAKARPITTYVVSTQNPRKIWLDEREPNGKLADPLSEEQQMLMFPLTFGFSLQTKRWIDIDASRLEEVPFSSEIMKSLVLDPHAIAVIDAIVARLHRKNAGRSGGWSADHIQGKGSGGLILLHGPPGVGKSFTVESIADKIQSPLLALTVADIGTEETTVENELSKWFALAESWKAVLLIDEADIFLERRHTRDLARNGLVSAFLRRTEFFNGLLFLTTNRVGHIDDAFMSRIHVAIQYNSLTGSDLARIWTGFFDKLTNDRSVNIRVQPSAKEWILTQFREGKYKGLNGRDVRNALQTAITLAEFEYESESSFDPSTDQVVVAREHFERVLNMNHKFREYVDRIRREDEQQRAHKRGDRYDGRDPRDSE